MAPSVNRRLPIDGAIVIGDLVYLRWRTVVEYEGSHHQQDRGQYVSDIDRYSVICRHAFAYVQVTKEKLARARPLTREVYRELVSRRYDGPPPRFGPRWHSRFTALHRLVAADHVRRRAGGAQGTVS